MKHPKKGESYYEKTFGKSRPEAASEPSEAKKTGKTNWRNKSDFSEAPVRRGKNEVAAPKEMRGSSAKGYDERKGGKGPARSGDFKRSSGEGDFRKEIPAFKKDRPDFKREDGEFRKERPAFKKDRPDFKREDGEFRKERPAFKKDRPDFKKEDGEFRKERPAFKKDRPDFKREDGEFRKERPAFKKDRPDFKREDGEFRKERPAFKKDRPDFKREDGEFRKERPAFKKDRPDFRKAEGEDRRERSATGKEDKAFKSEKPAYKKEGAAFRKDTADSKRKPSFPKEAPLSLQAENEVVREKIGSGKGKSDMISETMLTEAMPLNKYIAHCGICSRRDAAELIRQGKVKINGELVTEPGHKVEDGDQITVSGRKVSPQKDLTYILLNKPKGFITTTEDERGRRTVMDLVSDSGALRLYPIGRLDRNTTGLILLTNDGELSQKLSHPKYNVKKIYHVTLDKAISAEDFEKILAGVELEDGVAPVDSLAMLEERNELGIEIHSGKNRIVRRIFEHLGYEVARLDRVMYAGLTKKNLPRGKWRKLTEREIIFLKHFKQ